jgi:hypothetical protein
MRVFDCFTFFNELDMLELRLREMDSAVDVFVLVEADHTHSNLPKEWIFEQNKERFSKWLHKIRHIKVTDMPMSDDAWVNENHQRNAIARGLTDVESDDRILVSDCDEIIRPRTIEYIKNSPSEKWCLQMALFQYKLNYQRIFGGAHTEWGMAMRGDQLASTTPQLLRNQRHRPILPNIELVPHAGWHFAWQGDGEWLRTKLLSFAHQEYNSPENLEAYQDPDKFFEQRRGGPVFNTDRFEIVKLNDYFPNALIQDPSFLADRILPNAVHDAREFLPPYTL